MIRLLVVLLFSAGVSPASALTCDAFLDGMSTSTYATLLPRIEVEENEDLPGLFEMTNLRHIDVGYVCDGGRFDGLGATLYEGDQPDLMRWSAFVGAVIETVAPSTESPLELASRLQSEAMSEAPLEEVRTGIWLGRASEIVGDYEIAFEVHRGGVRISVDTTD